ncbi:MAG: hypothetical protein HeimC3_11340 [Candidatus Heimdallarchaeota archaeon LC_3]|nr:MAG: hypothetical protein HeimC3_11340 [Candidatus Heimdallarchaeota archaeon LC_3]
MSSNLEFDKEKVSKLSSYLSAIFNWKEKQIHFLPCVNGYLIFNDQEKVLLWIHKFTLEATLKIVFDLTKDIIEDVLFSLLIGGSIIQELVKSKFPDSPKQSLVFKPGLHAINYGNVIITDPDGKLGITMDFLGKTVSTVTSFVSTTGGNIAKIIKKESINDIKQREKKNHLTSKKENDSDDKSVVYIQILDSLYYHLSKDHKFKDAIPPQSGGYEFRTMFVLEAAKFLKLIKEKGKFTLNFKGEKKILF